MIPLPVLCLLLDLNNRCNSYSRWWLISSLIIVDLCREACRTSCRIWEELAEETKEDLIINMEVIALKDSTITSSSTNSSMLLRWITKVLDITISNPRTFSPMLLHPSSQSRLYIKLHHLSQGRNRWNQHQCLLQLLRLCLKINNSWIRWRICSNKLSTKMDLKSRRKNLLEMRSTNTWRKSSVN